MEERMDLTIWIPATFVLGLLLMAVVYEFLIACENI